MTKLYLPVVHRTSYLFHGGSSVPNGVLVYSIPSHKKTMLVVEDFSTNMKVHIWSFPSKNLDISLKCQLISKPKVASMQKLFDASFQVLKIVSSLLIQLQFLVKWDSSFINLDLKCAPQGVLDAPLVTFSTKAAAMQCPRMVNKVASFS